MARLLMMLGFILALAGPAGAHALQPGFLDLKALGGDAWRVFWKVPTEGAGAMAISALLPEACAPRQAEGLRFDGSAFVAEWVAICPGGLKGGEVRIEGLELTATDVLVRYELSPGNPESQRLTAATPGFSVPAPQGRLGVVATYFGLGVEHILLGIDHLLFVFALILLVRNKRQLIGAVTAFTVAHSLSLAAAALGWIVVPAPPVEAVVALSIMFLAAELVRPAGTARSLTARVSLGSRLRFRPPARPWVRPSAPRHRAAGGGGAAGALRLQPWGGSGAAPVHRAGAVDRDTHRAALSAVDARRDPAGRPRARGHQLRDRGARGGLVRRANGGLLGKRHEPYRLSL